MRNKESHCGHAAPIKIILCVCVKSHIPDEQRRTFFLVINVCVCDSHCECWHVCVCVCVSVCMGLIIVFEYVCGVCLRVHVFASLCVCLCV